MMRSMQEVDYNQFQLAKVPDFKLRVGVSTGKVIAGVVGSHKPLYDIWGDTVNIASRMDYTGERGSIHVPEATAKQLMQEDTFDMDTRVMCKKRGEIIVKGKGIMTTYFVELNEDLEVVEKSIYDTNDEEVMEYEKEKNSQPENYIQVTVEKDEVSEEKINKIDVKKDSGFGSQGHLEVDKIRVRY